MPFVWDLPTSQEPLARKRRKTSGKMARYSTPSQEDHHGQFLSEDNERPAEFLEVKDDRDEDVEMERTVRTSSREELIQCIKRGQRTTWVPKPGLEALCAEVNAQEAKSAANTSISGKTKHSSETGNTRTQPSDSTLADSTAADIVRRPLSTLHTAEPTTDYGQTPEDVVSEAIGIATPLRHSTSYQNSFSPPSWQGSPPPVPSLPRHQSSPLELLRRSRAPSLGSSLSSSFVMRVPTSPLIHATNNPALDFSPRHSRPSDSSTKASRRRTLPPNAFDSVNITNADADVPNFSRPLQLQQGCTQDDQSVAPGHRMRRSLSSFTYQPAPQTRPHNHQRPRRPSLAGELSPRRRTSMVGSFEESLLRGRMSTPPSQPFDFVAQIGVMGKGDCPASLKCPAHVTVPFTAVYYNYSTDPASRTIADDTPCPYVGNVDLEHHLKAPKATKQKSRPSQTSIGSELDLHDSMTHNDSPTDTILSRKSRNKPSSTANVPLGGAYRVPMQGQLQVILKTPNKTAVKLFLIPYDLQGMAPGTKTFVRQRSYSSGPLLETSRPEQQAILAARDPLSSKDILRYLIHLNFCCTAKGRYYLHDAIRVVFANRVPDGKEKLRTEVQLPEPRFSDYKPLVKTKTQTVNGPFDTSMSSFGPALSPNTEILDGPLLLDLPQQRRRVTRDLSTTPFRFPSPPPVQHVPTATYNDQLQQSGEPECQRAFSPVAGFLPSTSARGSPLPWNPSDESSTPRAFSPPPPMEPIESLLTRRLRDLQDPRNNMR
jgi:hypothetical protein